MPRAKKNQVNPVTEMLVYELEPRIGEPNIDQPLIKREIESTKSNVVPINTSSEPIQSDRDWSDIDSVLSDVVSFG